MFISAFACVLAFYTTRGSCLLASGGDDVIGSLAELQHNLTQLQNRGVALENNISALYKTNAEQTSTILSLEHLVAEQQKKISVLESTLNSTLEYNRTFIHHEFIISSMRSSMKNLTETMEKAIVSLEQSINTTSEDSQQQILTLQGYLRRNVNAHDIIIHDLVSTTNNISHKALSLENRLNDFVLIIDNVTNKVSKLGKQVQYESLAVAKTVQQMQEMTSTLQNKIVFTVSKAHDAINMHNRTIIYDKVITNKGNAYDANTGVFTCPSGGDYLFIWSALSANDQQSCHVFIYKNGVEMLEAASYEARGGYSESSSNAMIVSLGVNDRIWTETRACGYYYGFPYTAFSGMKL